MGLDHGSVVSRGRAGNKISVEVVLTRLQAGKLTDLGLPLTEKWVAETTALPANEQASRQRVRGLPLLQRGGWHRDEFPQLARGYPRLTKLDIRLALLWATGSEAWLRAENDPSMRRS